MCVTNTLLRRKPVALSLNAFNSSASSLPKCVPSANTVQPAQSVFDGPRPSNGITQPKRLHKRQRKPQKPGKTAKNQERHFVVHNYHDHAFDPVPTSEDEGAARQTSHHQHDSKGHFPMKLHGVLDEVESEGLGHIISWMPHGRCFVIHKPKEFTERIMHKYFRQSKLTSFQRQLNLYGFQRISRGNDAGGYYNEFFLRGKASLCKSMTRVKVKGTLYKAASNPDQEPNFYSMPYVSTDYVPSCMKSAQLIPSQPTLPYHCHSSTPVCGYVSPTDDVPMEPVLESDEDVLMSSPIHSVDFDLFHPIPLDGHGAEWDREMSPLMEVEELSPEMFDFCSDWIASGEDNNTDAFEEVLESDDKLAFMIGKLLED